VRWAVRVLLSVGALLVSLLSGPELILLLLRLLLVEAAWLLPYGQWKAIQVALGEAEGTGMAFAALGPGPILTALARVLVAARAAGAG
jgi:hypothetical protein